MFDKRTNAYVGDAKFPLAGTVRANDVEYRVGANSRDGNISWWMSIKRKGNYRPVFEPVKDADDGWLKAFNHHRRIVKISPAPASY